MPPRDPHRFVNELDEPALARLIDRLESRGKDRVFTRLFDNYAARLDLAPGARVLDIGCGTGVVSRALARRSGGAARIAGVDRSPAFIAAARRFAEEESLAGAIEFRVCDAHDLPFGDAIFDAATAHTLLSHAADPARVLAEARRVLKPGGALIAFDGDYASLTYGFGDPEAGRRMDWALARAAFNDPVVIRGLPELLRAAGLELRETLADVVCEIGEASYFRSMAETYAPLIAPAGLAAAEDVEAWLAWQRGAMAEGRFFASCNYYAHCAVAA